MTGTSQTTFTDTTGLPIRTRFTEGENAKLFIEKLDPETGEASLLMALNADDAGELARACRDYIAYVRRCLAVSLSGGDMMTSITDFEELDNAQGSRRGHADGYGVIY